MMRVNDRFLLDKFIRQGVDRGELTAGKPNNWNRGLLKKLTPLQEEIINFHPPLYERKCEGDIIRKTLTLGRRSGKTHLLGVKCIAAGQENPGSTALFVSTSREHSKRLLWHELHNLNDRFSLGFEFNATELKVFLPNGSIIWLHGAACKSDCERFRGNKYSFSCVDEAGSFPDFLEYLCDDVLAPAMGDYDGELWLSGTPNASCTGYFYEHTVLRDDVYYQYVGDVRDNPFFIQWENVEDYRPLAEKYLESLAASPTWKAKPNSFRREYLAEWVRDDNVLVIPWDETRNSYEVLPSYSDYEYIIGIDFGVVDATAIVVAGYNKYDRTLYMVHAEEHTELSYQETVDIIRDLDETYRPVVITGDPSPGKLFIQDLDRLYGLPMQVAKKRDKAHNLEMLAQQFRSGQIKVSNDLDWVKSQLKMIQWKSRSKKTLDERFPDHIFHALLYLVVESDHTWSLAPPDSPQGRAERINIEMKNYEQQLIRQLHEQESENWLFDSSFSDTRGF